MGAHVISLGLMRKHELSRAGIVPRSFLARRGQSPLVQSPHMNRLLFGHNLNWLRNPWIFPDASLDLVYLAPPFNSNICEEEP
jgi:hypothetical protein